jgi:hypothetical protein
MMICREYLMKSAVCYVLLTMQPLVAPAGVSQTHNSQCSFPQDYRGWPKTIVVNSQGRTIQLPMSNYLVTNDRPFWIQIPSTLLPLSFQS